MKVSMTHSVDYRMFSLAQTACQKANLTALLVPGGSTCCSPSSSSCSCGATSVEDAQEKH